MNTATVNSTAAQLPTRNKTMFWRFAWKEFRMIRGLWAAVAILGLFIQCVERMLLTGATDFPQTLLYTALSAAVLYAVGAAATMFSVEHEEETYEFLARLPNTWWPPYAAKLAITLLSAFLLAGLLSISAVALRGPHFIGEANFRNALGMMGFAIIEATAWGTLFSLLIKRPLLAAIVTLVVGTIVSNLVVTSSSADVAAGVSPAAYVDALPLRLAIVVAVFGCSVFAARRWLVAGTSPSITSELPTGNRFTAWLARGRTSAREVSAVAAPVPRRRMLARLLWQTWHESWKLLFAPIVMALLLLIGITAALGLTHELGEVASFVISACLLFAPAIYGVMAFYIDQRRGSYRFLAEHAARPRYIWLARHIVWLSALITAGILVTGTFAAIAGRGVQLDSHQLLIEYLEWHNHADAVGLIYAVALGSKVFVRVLFAGSCGALVAYSIGQLFSMTVRSEILAAVLAMILTFIFTAWVWVVCLWQLSPIWFLLPLFAGLMLATWLRAPDWIAGRNSWHAWWKPALAIVAPVFLIATMLPGARLAQVAPTISKDPHYNQRRAEADRAFAQRLAEFQAGDTGEAAKTADMYTRVAEKLAAGMGHDFLKRWEKPEYMSDTDDDFGIGEKKIPPDELEAFRKAKKDQLTATQQYLASIINECIDISHRPTCRFHFDSSLIMSRPPEPPSSHTTPAHSESKPGSATDLATNRTFYYLNMLIGEVAGEPMSQPDDPLRRFLAALRMGRHFRSGQTAFFVAGSLREEQVILGRIAEWAMDPKRTKEELRDALDKLTADLQSPESPADALLADHVLIRAVIDGQQVPFIMSANPVAAHVYLAYLANQPWWERERAEKALEQITRANLARLDGLTRNLQRTDPHDVGIESIRRSLQPYSHGLPQPWRGGGIGVLMGGSDDNILPEAWQITNYAAMTSYLLTLEYIARVPVADLTRAYCDNVTVRRGTLLQIALMLYRLDHGKYPERLTDLVPKYLEQLPLDPYARQPFQYGLSGLNLPLRYWHSSNNYEDLKPNTPFLWSVGEGNVRLKQIGAGNAAAEPESPKTEGDEPTPEKPTACFAFGTDGQFEWRDSTLVFPLPK